jgi:hypothetical protein
MASEADVIYNAFGLGTDEHRSIVRALRDRYPGTPVVIETSRPSAAQHAELLRDCVVSELPVTSRTMVAAVRTALASR